MNWFTSDTREMFNLIVWRARERLREAVRQGVVIKPGRCEKCGKKKKLEAHHADYARPLEVIF